MADDKRSGYQLFYEESSLGLSRQERAVETFYSRAGLLLAATVAASAFLGREVLGDGRAGCLGVAAIVVFLLVCSATLYLLWPRTWHFSVDAKQAIADYLEPEDGAPLPLDEIYRDLALHAQTRFASNSRQMRQLGFILQAASIGLIVDLGLWAAALALQ